MQPKRAPTSPITNCRLTAVLGVVSHAVTPPTKLGAYPGLASHAEAQRRGPITVHSAGRILPALRSSVLSISGTPDHRSLGWASLSALRSNVLSITAARPITVHSAGQISLLYEVFLQRFSCRDPMGAGAWFFLLCGAVY